MPPVRLTLLVTLVAALAVTAFVWPAARLEPRGLPIGVVGAAPPQWQGDRFEIHRYDSEADARAAVRRREVYGALAGPTLLVATGASPAVAAALRDMAPPQARVVDLAPGTEADPRAATLAALALPLTLLGIAAAGLAVFLARTTRDRLLLLSVGSLMVGATATLIAQTWLDGVPGSWLGIAGVVALTVAAVGATVTGLAAHLGHAGIGLGAILMLLVANPWSGMANAPELLPPPAGALGQLLPTGAGGDLLRSVAFFDGAAAGGHLVVLAAWALAGLALIFTAGSVAPARDAARAPSHYTS
jgi:hypothetical protein